MFGTRRTEAALSALRAENSDLRAQLRLEREQWARERQALLDRILAREQPAVLREVRRAPTQQPEPSFIAPKARRPRLYPSEAVPPRPPSPPTPPVAGSVSLTDAQAHLLTEES